MLFDVRTDVCDSYLNSNLAANFSNDTLIHLGQVLETEESQSPHGADIQIVMHIWSFYNAQHIFPRNPMVQCQRLNWCLVVQANHTQCFGGKDGKMIEVDTIRIESGWTTKLMPKMWGSAFGFRTPRTFWVDIKYVIGGPGKSDHRRRRRRHIFSWLEDLKITSKQDKEVWIRPDHCHYMNSRSLNWYGRISHELAHGSWHERVFEYDLIGHLLT